MADAVSTANDSLPRTGTDPLWVDAYQRYHRLWFTLARTSHISEDDARDIVHGVIASILADTRLRFDSKEHIRNYVAKAVLNRVILHRQQSLRRMPLGEVCELASEYISADDRIEQIEEDKLLRSALLSLRRRDFEIVKLRFFSGLTFAEIGQLLGKPISTLKSREVSALKKIKKKLGKDGLV